MVSGGTAARLAVPHLGTEHCLHAGCAPLKLLGARLIYSAEATSVKERVARQLQRTRSD